MNKRRIFLHSLNRFCMAGAFIAVMLFAACDDDEIIEGRPNWDTICFNPVQQTDGWMICRRPVLLEMDQVQTAPP